MDDDEDFDSVEACTISGWYTTPQPLTWKGVVGLALGCVPHVLQGVATPFQQFGAMLHEAAAYDYDRRQWIEQAARELDALVVSVETA